MGYLSKDKQTEYIDIFKKIKSSITYNFQWAYESNGFFIGVTNLYYISLTKGFGKSYLYTAIPLNSIMVVDTFYSPSYKDDIYMISYGQDYLITTISKILLKDDFNNLLIKLQASVYQCAYQRQDPFIYDWNDKKETLSPIDPSNIPLIGNKKKIYNKIIKTQIINDLPPRVTSSWHDALNGEREEKLEQLKTQLNNKKAKPTQTKRHKRRGLCCPKCHSTNVELIEGQLEEEEYFGLLYPFSFSDFGFKTKKPRKVRSKGKLLAGLMTNGLSLLFTGTKKEVDALYICKDCGKKFYK